MNIRAASLWSVRRQCLGPVRRKPPPFWLASDSKYSCFQSRLSERKAHFGRSSHQQDVGSQFSQQNTPYDILGLPYNASNSEIKKKFYELSKRHHPDHNKGDPSANERFIEISQAYQILSSPTRKASYDRLLKRQHPRSFVQGSQVEQGPVGGREASGLSRRRTVPQGPPPSYYRMQKARATGANHSQTNNPYTEGIGVGGPTSSRKDDVPHFNWDEKYRQHREYQNRLKQNFQSRSQASSKSTPSNVLDVAVQAILVGGCVLLAGVIGSWVVSLGSRKNSNDSR